jgi:hypothetical protein
MIRSSGDLLSSTWIDGVRPHCAWFESRSNFATMACLRHETRWLDLEYSDGIFYFGVKSGAEVNASVLEEYIVIAEKMLGDDIPVPILTRLGRISGATAEAMRIAGEPRYAKLCARCAIVVQNPVARVIGSVFLGLCKPPYPTKLFSGSEHAALAWLRQGQELRQKVS